MTSDIVVSSLPLSTQLARLRTLLAEHGYALPPTEGETACRSLNLRKARPAAAAAKQLADALRVCRISIKHTLALEAIATMCGWDCRMRQLSLPLKQLTSRYVVQMTRDAEVQSTFIESKSLSAAGKAVRDYLRNLWPTEVSPALCTLRVAPKAITFELEHGGAPWLSGHIVQLLEGPGEPKLLDFAEKELRRFIPDMQRALEYRHPGLLVLGGLRSDRLPPWYEFAPIIRHVESGKTHECTGEFDLFAILDGYKIPDGPMACNTAYVLSADGAQRLEPRWTSAVDGTGRSEPISPAALSSLRNRDARLRGVTGCTMTQFFARLFTGKPILQDCHRFDTRAMEAKREQLGLSLNDLAGSAGLAVHELLRMRRYGWSDTRALPAIARALKIEDPNELLPPVDEDRLGIHVENGEHFVNALRETHWWRRIIGDGVQGTDAQAIERIAESLQEWIDLLQFATGPFGSSSTGSEEPVTPEGVAAHIQKELEELAAMNVAVVVERSIRYVSHPARLPGMERSPLNHATLYFEKIGQLRQPGYRHAA
jgi:hypothetical protein